MLLEKNAVKSVSIAASDRALFSPGAVEGDVDRWGRFRSDDPIVALSVASRHSHLEPRVHFPHPTTAFAKASSAHAHGPPGAHEPHESDDCSPGSTSSGGEIICEMENEWTGCRGAGADVVLAVLCLGPKAGWAEDADWGWLLYTLGPPANGPPGCPFCGESSVTLPFLDDAIEG